MMNTNLETMKMMLELTKAGFSKAEVLAACGISVNSAPEVAPAEAIGLPPVEVVKPVKKAPTMSREAFLALGAETPLYQDQKSSKKTSARVDLGVMDNGLVVFNGFLPGDSWWYNHHKMLVDYKAKSIKRGGTWGYTFDSLADRNSCLSQFSVKQHFELTEEDHHNCKAWREDKSWMKK